MKTFFHLRAAAALGLVLLAAALPGWGQTLTLANWSIDVFSPSPTFGLADGNPRTPCFTNNGIAQSTLYANCPLGAPLKLAAAGDGIFCTGQAVITGDVNADGNLQFRFGLFFQGNHPADTNWLGYLFGNYVGNHEGAASALMVRNNPNPGIYATGYPGNIMRPKCGQVAYMPKRWIGNCRRPRRGHTIIRAPTRTPLPSPNRQPLTRRASWAARRSLIHRPPPTPSA